jgi:WD40 repeat protein
VFDILSGVKTHELTSHNRDEGEIAYIGYGGDDGTIVTIGWDRTIMVHNDDPIQAKVLRGAPNSHSKDVIAGDYAHYLGLIATGSRDKLVKVWDYERVQVQHTIVAHKEELSIVKFLKPFPLLLTADSNGYLYIWLTKPMVNNAKLILSWRNLQNIKDHPPVTAVDTYYQRGATVKDSKLYLFIGDESGKVSVQDLRVLLQKIEGLEEVDVTDPKKPGPKRNPHRPINFDKDLGKNQEKEIAIELMESSLKEEGLVKETEVKQVCTFNPHKDVIRSIQFIYSTDRPLIMTASLDRFVHIHSIDFNNADSVEKREKGMVSSLKVRKPFSGRLTRRNPASRTHD